MRAEAAETKVSADSKLAEARRMAEDAQNKFSEAEAKLRAAESLQADANRYHRSAERKLQEVEAREEDLTRRILSFKSEYVFHLVCTIYEAMLLYLLCLCVVWFLGLDCLNNQ